MNGLPFEELSDRSNLTRAQLLIWMGQGLQPESPLYNMVLAFSIHGRIDARAFTAAFDDLVRASDALRTVFAVENGIPQRRVREAVDGGLEVHDLSSRPDPELAWREWKEAAAQRIFDPTAPMFHSALLRLGEASWVWYLNQHHLITDGWSTALVYQRLEERYRMALDGNLEAAPALPLFETYVESERRRRASTSHARAVEHWKEKATGAPPAPEFYGVSPLGARSTRTERLSIALGNARSDGLRRLASTPEFRALSSDLALFNLFATVLFVFLFRITRQGELAILAPSHNRPSRGFKETVGLFIEILPIHLSLSDDDTWTSAHAKLSEETRSFLLHSLPGTSTASAHRAYSVLLNFIHASFSSFGGHPMTSEWVHSGHGDGNHALRLQVHDFDASGSFQLHFDLHRDIFDADRRRWVGEHFLRTLDALLEAPARPLGEIDLLSGSERRALLVTFNTTENRPAGSPEETADVPIELTVVDAFLTQARRHPDRVALRHGDATASYRDLDAHSVAVAQCLRDLGLSPGSVVAVVAHRSPALIASILGALRAGVAYVPIDAAYPPDRVRHLVEASGAGAVLTDASLESELPRLQVPVCNVEAGLGAPHTGSVLETPAASPAPASGSAPGSTTSAADAPPGPADLAYVMYTSGSTGAPKGVMISHAALFNYVSWARDFYLRGRPTTFALYSSIAFDLTVTSIFVPLCSGNELVLYRETGGPDLTILQVVADDAVDLVKLTPSHLALVAHAGLRASRISTLILGGEDLKSDLAAQARTVFGPEVTLYNEYGPTEATVGCMVHRLHEDDLASASVPIGRPVAGARIYVLDPKLRPVPMGVAGEMCIAGPGLAEGYFEAPELTADRFVEIDAPWAAHGERIYRTGDLARWRSADRLEFLGRSDHQVKIRGARIELGEIESALLAHPLVASAAVRVFRADPSAREARAIRHCVRCGLPSNHPEAQMGEDETCRVCLAYDTYKDRAGRYFRTLDDLRALFAGTPHHPGDPPRPAGAPGFDCMMLLSGGKDSTYALYQLVDMGLRVLAFSLDNGFISEGAKQNIRRAVDELGVDLIFASTPAMNAIFADSLRSFSNVCNGCFKTIYTLALREARERNIPFVVTGLSRGQIFETRIADFFRNGIYDPDEIDRAIVEARKAYHRRRDAVTESLDCRVFADDRIFEDVQIVDFYRYCDVRLGEMLNFLGERAPWIRPADTGRSTNCLINETGIFVHTRERGYHNYALPYSWDVRLGHKTRRETLEELDDDIDVPRHLARLNELGYEGPAAVDPAGGEDLRLVAYYTSRDESFEPETVRAHLASRLPPFMVPSHVVRLESLPLTARGKVDTQALPDPREAAARAKHRLAPPETEIEAALAEIWASVLGLEAVGIHDHFLELGGDSILNIQIVTRAKSKGLQFAPRQLFDHPTVAELARVAQVVAAPDGAPAPVPDDAAAGHGTGISQEEIDRIFEEFGEDMGDGTGEATGDPANDAGDGDADGRFEGKDRR